jgi:spermidine/putrescine transport system substrate-binding protein
MKSIKPEIAKNTAVFPDKAALAKLEMLKDLDSKKRRIRNSIWTAIRAS